MDVQQMQEMLDRGREASKTLREVKAFFRSIPLATRLAFQRRNLASRVARAEAILAADWT